MANDILEKLKSSLLDLDMDATIENVNSIIRSDGTVSVQEAIDAISEALQVVGKRFQDGDWFLTELVYSGEIAKAAMELLSPLLAVGTSQKLGTIIVGTVAGDLHDLGKNIFINFARSAGFEVIDLGVDVDKDKFIGAVKEYSPLALGMSCLLTVTAAEIGKVIEEMKVQGIRNNVQVIIGGACLTEGFAKDVGADAFAPDAVTGTDIIKKWIAL
jgi:methanogenic corrinoid protein MtbC1